jgi:hypothetical protein
LALEPGDLNVTDDAPDRPPMVQFLQTLNAGRHAKVSAAVGALFAVVIYGFFVVAPVVFPGVPARGRSPLLFLLLAFVAAVTTAMLLVTLLTVVSAVRLARTGGPDP